MSPQGILTIVFAIIVLGFLVVDLGFLNRRAHHVTTKSAVIQSLFWLCISLIFGGLIFAFIGHSAGVEFLSAYVTEKMLSVDNLFVIMLIFIFFGIENKYQHKVLFWGILGAIVFRGIFIGSGSLIVSHFHWVLYIFGAILVYTGFKLFLGKSDDSINVEENKVLKLARRYLPLDYSDNGDKFVIKDNGKRYFTLLFVVLLVVETTDIIFAFDSIPAVFAITQDPFIVFTSNIFAVMGLRALFFLVESIMSRFCYLQTGLSFVLVFIGGKMLAGIAGLEVSSLISFAVIIGTLVLAAICSIVKPKKE